MLGRTVPLLVSSLVLGFLAAKAWPTLAMSHPALVWLGAAWLVLAIALIRNDRKRRELERKVVALDAAKAQAPQQNRPDRSWPHSPRPETASYAIAEPETAYEPEPAFEHEEPIDWYATQIKTLDAAAADDPDHLRRATVLNKREQAIHDICLAWAEAHHFRLVPQTNIGVFVKTRGSEAADKAVHRTYNSKRVDFLICSTGWWPQIVVEHQGGGHGQDDADGRFAVKRRVFDRLMLPLVETRDDETAHSVHVKLDAALQEARRSNDLYWARAKALREGGKTDGAALP